MDKVTFDCTNVIARRIPGRTYSEITLVNYDSREKQHNYVREVCEMCLASTSGQLIIKQRENESQTQET